MPVRGHRSIWPSKGRAPTGIFSTRGKQKVDSTSHFPDQDCKNYAHSTSSRSKPKGTGGAGLRHQKPKKIW